MSDDQHIFKVGKLRGEVVRYKDGLGCCIWQPLVAPGETEEDSQSGLAFDFSHHDLADFAEMLARMQNPAEDQIRVCEWTAEDEAREQARKAEQQSFWYRLKWFLRDWGIQIMPFDWEWKLGTKHIFYTMKNPLLALGPIKITKGEWKDK
jgi:hypothetical protein